ncbi:beta-1,3-galactosyltransferase 5-like [Babylonia areolata]|uniref:beta-1,3-galactosyltransferase 5-like n=1 Tax=Babylonia areolata TaxID=304850 RepID=UPI003FD15785
MRPWQGLSEVHSYFTGSEYVMVSVYVQQNSMPSQSLSRASRRFLLKTGIWSVIAIVVAFFVIYTILLIYVNRPFESRQHVFLGSSGDYHRPKIRLLGKSIANRNNSLLHYSSERSQGKMVWDPGQFDDSASTAPTCRRGSLFIIVVTSSPDHFQHRRAIRNTWCRDTAPSIDSAWQCFFLVGHTHDADTNEKLSSESVMFRDIVRGSYVDSYRNLTHKVLHGLTWVSRNCEVPFVLKTDDDCFVNVALFRHFLLHQNTRTTNLYAGNMLTNENRRKVIRNPNEKWSVSEEAYLPEYYPVYASGSGYALSFDVVTKLVEQSKYKKSIPNEDAYIGIVINSLRIPPTYSGRFSLSSSGLRVCNFLYIFLAHGVDPGMQVEMEKKAVAARSECKDEEVNEWF